MAAISQILCPICKNLNILGSQICNNCGYALKLTLDKPFKICVRNNEHKNDLNRTKCSQDGSDLVYFEKQIEGRSCGRVLINFLLQCEALRIDISPSETLLSNPKDGQYLSPPFKTGVNSQVLCNYFASKEITRPCDRFSSQPEDYDSDFIIASLQYFGHFLKKQYLYVSDISRISFDPNDFYVIQILTYNKRTMHPMISGHWYGVRSINGIIYYAEPLDQMSKHKIELDKLDNIEEFKERMEKKKKEKALYISNPDDEPRFNIFIFNPNKKNTDFMNIICFNCSKVHCKLTDVLSFNPVCTSRTCNYQISYTQQDQPQVLSAAAAAASTPLHQHLNQSSVFHHPQAKPTFMPTQDALHTSSKFPISSPPPYQSQMSQENKQEIIRRLEIERDGYIAKLSQYQSELEQHQLTTFKKTVEIQCIIEQITKDIQKIKKNLEPFAQMSQENKQEIIQHLEIGRDSYIAQLSQYQSELEQHEIAAFERKVEAQHIIEHISKDIQKIQNLEPFAPASNQKICSACGFYNDKSIVFCEMCQQTKFHSGGNPQYSKQNYKN